MNQNIQTLTRALAFAADAHANQRRKGAAQEPYINHLIEVMDLVAQATDGDDIELLIAALLHDVIEDTPTTREDVAQAFGERVAEIVTEVTDDMSLPKPERRRRRIASMPHKSKAARIVKTADVISNVRAMVISAPAGWTDAWKLHYLNGCRDLMAAGSGANEELDKLFGETAASAEQCIRDGSPMVIGDHVEAVHELHSAIGQPVHLIYLPNTRNLDYGRAEVLKLADLVRGRFPSGTIQMADAVYDGDLRSIVTLRIRTDSSESVVAFAQKLCLEFDERFVGIEVSGRYIRVYADDTG